MFTELPDSAEKRYSRQLGFCVSYSNPIGSE
jgi:hypothetical protein